MEDKQKSDISLNLENTYINLPKMFFTKQNPESVPNPKLIILNEDLAHRLSLDINKLKSVEGVETLVGNRIPNNSVPIAQAYAGHQFGYFTMLGDGRAILLGEIETNDHNKFDIQLKGSGITPYSRGGDGKATLGAMLREYIISEAMYNLKILTTRSLAVIETGEDVVRENILKGAVLVRIASSHIRVGTFEYAREYGNFNDLKSLADYTINRHYKNIIDSDNKYKLLLREVIKNQAQLIAKWQLIGFIHGVMNTDNMTISGETIDYGPCAFMDVYNKKTVFSYIDTEGRYAYENQPPIGKWNLTRFAEALLPLIDSNYDNAVKMAQEEISKYSGIFKDAWISGMRKKLGIYNKEQEDEELINLLLNIMEKNKMDFTNTFYLLSSGRHDNNLIYNNNEFKKWYKLWQSRLTRQDETLEECKKLMMQNNPVIIPRNYYVEEALKSATNKGDYSDMNDLLKALSNPYDYSKDFHKYTMVPKQNTCYKTFCGT